MDPKNPNDFLVSFPTYLSQMGAEYEVKEHIKFMLLTKSLTPAARSHLQLQQEKAQKDGKPVLFADFWKWLKANYGQDIRGQL